MIEFDELPVQSVLELEPFQDEYVYDIEMAEGTEHTFFANDILVHNSVYFTIGPILKKRNIKLLDDDGTVSDLALQLTEQIEQYLNEQIGVWARKALNTKDSRFVFKREAICDSGLFFDAKKRYVLNLKNDEGVDVNKIKYVGMDVVRSSFSEPVKDLIRSVVKSIFETKDPYKVNQVYRACFEKYKKLDVDQISIRVNLKELDKYSEKSNNFSIGKGTPVHAKASIYYNELLKKLEIDNLYESLDAGMKVKWFYCSKNKYQVPVMAYLDGLPPEIAKDIEPDHKKMFKKVSKAIGSCITACGWQMDDLSYDYATNLMDFLS